VDPAASTTVYRCPKDACSRLFDSLQSAEHHAARQHATLFVLKPNKCPACGSRFSPKYSILGHRRNCAALDNMFSRGEYVKWETAD